MSITRFVCIPKDIFWSEGGVAGALLGASLTKLRVEEKEKYTV